MDSNQPKPGPDGTQLRRFADAHPHRRRVLFFALMIALAWGAAELTSWTGLYVLRRTGRISERAGSALTLTAGHRERIESWIDPGGIYFAHSPALGWTIKPNGQAHIYRSNMHGIRADREYALTPPSGVVRIASFGDSFTHCAEVAVDDSWQRRLELLDSKFEALNFGVDAYGPDQSFLRYVEDGPRFRPHIVLVGFMSENLLRTVSVFRPFYQPRTGAPFTKPRFVLDGPGLRLVPNPIPELVGYRHLLEDTEPTLRRLGTFDHYFQVLNRDFIPARLPTFQILGAVGQVLSGRDPLLPGLRHGVYDTSSEAYRVTAAIFDRFHEAVVERGSLPIIVVFPNQADLGRHQRSLPRRYQPLIDEFERKGYAYIDLLHGLTSISPGSRFAEGGHYAPAANARVAALILEYLRTRGLDTPSGIAQHLASARAPLAIGAERPLAQIADCRAMS
jgi:hypothetical protein